MTTPDEIQRLATSLSSSDPQERQTAAETLMQLGAAAYPAAAALVEACGYEDTRQTCAETLEALDAPTTDQLPRLGDLVGAAQLDVSYWAATLLGRAGEEAAAYTQRLEQVATDSNHQLAARERAVWALGKIGPAANGSVAALESLAANSTSPRLARLAEAALEAIRD